jgi:hypothetical protein
MARRIPPSLRPWAIWMARPVITRRSRRRSLQRISLSALGSSSDLRGARASLTRSFAPPV